jgi:hypothetical protein
MGPESRWFQFTCLWEPTSAALQLLGVVDTADAYASRSPGGEGASFESRFDDMAEDFLRSGVAIRREGSISLADPELPAELAPGWIAVPRCSKRSSSAWRGWASSPVWPASDSFRLQRPMASPRAGVAFLVTGADGRFRQAYAFLKYRFMRSIQTMGTRENTAKARPILAPENAPDCG